MCGIAGKIDFAAPIDETLIHRMCSVIEHRGPDARGVYVDGGVGLGAQRLAIIDVAGGDQPIFNEDRSVAVVMNGEIYNFPELRRELQERGHRFSSRSDTEVLVHLYEDHGETMVRRLRGMFAFAIWDARRRRLFCARDRVGKKPLFWARKGSRVWFASELRALLEDSELERDIDPAAIDAYLALQYVPHPLSAFKRIRKLAPASTLSVTADGETTDTYWSLDYTQKLRGVAEKELEEQLRELIREATEIRLMSEVPLGAFLSGGLDSTAVVAAMAEQMAEPVKTFSIGFPDAAFDELRFARIAAERFGTDHHEFVVEPKALEIMPRLARQYGEPFADASAIPSFYLAELTSRHVTVALNGDGGDESFAGYRRYVGNDRASRLNGVPLPLRRLAPLLVRPLGEDARMNGTRSRIQRFARTLAMAPPDRYAHWMSIVERQRRSRLFTPDFAAAVYASAEDFITTAWTRWPASGQIDLMLSTDVQTYLPCDLLVKMDIATMAYSVEARSPFLDHRLMEFAASLPPDEKLRGSAGKRLLKRALRGRVPDEILDRPKMGFGVPLGRWFREDLRQLPADVLLDARALDRGYFRRHEVEVLIDEHRAGSADHSARLWSLLQLEMWHREVVDAPVAADERTDARVRA
jgi:asparagine synthase (glutamine-hydrolysing)